MRSYNQQRCFQCRKSVDTTRPAEEPYVHSVTHGVYFHLGCWEKYEGQLITSSKSYVKVPEVRRAKR